MIVAPALDLADLLACPDCRGPLGARRNALHCVHCCREYAVVDGIPALFPATAAQPASDSPALYDRIASEYDETIPRHVAGHYLTRRISFIRRLMAGTAATKPAGAILDVCCGTGRLIAVLAELGYSVAGIDASIGMLRVSRHRNPATPVIAGHAQRLPFRDGAFDLVVSVAALHHIAAPDLVATALSEMCRVARPNGKILVWDHNPLNPYWPRLMARVPQDSGEERLVPRAEIERGLSAAGCTRIETRRLGFTPDFLPRPALPIWGVVEALAEATPVLREHAAHNVILAQKGGPT